MRFVACIALGAWSCASVPAPEVAPAVIIEPTPIASRALIDEPAKPLPAVEPSHRRRTLDRKIAAATPREKQLAREDMRRGLELFNAGKMAEALYLFEHAYAYVPAPTVELYMGRAFAKLGRTEEARTVFQRLASERDNPDDPPAYRAARISARNAAAALAP
jgi:thioredoxin-like negative regulator of GroEL